MTDDNTGKHKPRPGWVKDAEAALDDAGKALRSAWDASREARLSALAAAKQAANQLGEAIEQGVTAIKEKPEPQTTVTEPEPATTPESEPPRVDAEVEATGLPPDEEE